jgi:hypothetical protein
MRVFEVARLGMRTEAHFGPHLSDDEGEVVPSRHDSQARSDRRDKLAEVGYVADRDLATALWMMEFSNVRC